MTYIPDYSFEIRQKAGKTYNFCYRLDERMQPYLSRQLGAADNLTLNLPLNSEPAQFIINTKSDLELWHWGRDKKLKQVYVIVQKERYKDFGSTSMTGGSGRLGSGSGVNLLISADGPEHY